MTDGQGRVRHADDFTGAFSQNDPGWIDRIHPDDAVRLPMRRHTADGEPQQVELRLRDGDDGDWRWHRLRAVPVRDGRGRVVEWVGVLHDIHERKIEAARRDLVVGELRHRLKNLIAIIEALAKYSAPRQGSEPAVDAFLQRFLGRLHALSAASDLLIAGHNKTIEANGVVHATLAPFMSDLAPRFHIAGPDLQLSEHFGGGLALAVHELATNAIKYGALSAPSGRVSFTWSVTPTDDGDRIAFEWKENGGPAPSPPEKEGFGMRMIRSVTAREKSGGVAIDYEPDGLRCRISAMHRADAAVS